MYWDTLSYNLVSCPSVPPLSLSLSLFLFLTLSSSVCLYVCFFLTFSLSPSFYAGIWEYVAALRVTYLLSITVLGTYVHVLVSLLIQFSSLSLNTLYFSFAFSFCLLFLSLSLSLTLSLFLSLSPLQKYVAVLRVTYLFSITFPGTVWF